MNLCLRILSLIFVTTTGPATVYWPGDGQCGPQRADGRAFKPHDYHVAHRTIRLGTVGILCSQRTSRCTVVSVQDRGPFGAIQRQPRQGCKPYRTIRWRGRVTCWRATTRLPIGWRWRGEFDLTRAVAQTINHRPFDHVVFYYWPKKRNYDADRNFF